MTSLKCCYNEVSQRLDTDGIRMDNLDEIISRLGSKVDDNLDEIISRLENKVRTTWKPCRSGSCT